MRTPVLGKFPRIQCFAAFILTLLIVPSIVAQTQSTTGTIQGTVVDANGAVVPGANVEIKNLETNFTRTLTTDEDGRFVAPLLQPGNYSVTVAKQGFATTVLESTVLTVGQALSIPFSLKVSDVAERVTVTSTPTVDTAKTEASTTLNEVAVSTTPILGRKFEDLLTLTPNVSITQGPDGDEINFAGQRGIINVITKSGTNEVHGSAFYFQRLEALTANTSDGKPLDNFHREQYGGTVGGPFKKDKAFYFLAFEGIRENLDRANLSEQIGSTPCPVTTPTILANEAAISGNDDCARLALINFMRTTRNQEEGLPVSHKINNQAFFSRVDYDFNSSNHLSVSYNFDYSKNTNQTFDVATYGNSANGIEGPSKINDIRANLFTTVSPTKLNEAHFSYSRELRPRSAVDSNVPADTAMGFATTFRFGFPFFVEPNVDELIWRTQAKDNFSIISGDHNFKFGGEWLHTLNDQVFRGFFTGRYIFDSPEIGRAHV